MQKIPTIFKRNPENMRELTKEHHPDAEWVFNGEGVATRKYDGTCVMMDEDGLWWARREVKADKPEPDGFVAISIDVETGKTVGWEPIEQSSFYKFFQEALVKVGEECAYQGWVINPGTYELCGPKINKNPEGYPFHYLVSHAEAEVLDWTRETSDIGTFHHMVQYLSEEHGWEGIVWHHPDGRMAKLKARDFK